MVPVLIDDSAQCLSCLTLIQKRPYMQYVQSFLECGLEIRVLRMRVTQESLTLEGILQVR